jgi:predicted nucleic acid-binding protein
MTGFWDASAVVPLCVPVQDSGRGRHLLREHALVVWWGTSLEVLSALARLRRQRLLDDYQLKAALERLAELRKSWREVQPTERVRDLAERLLERDDLRAADALQLAAALVWCREHPRRRAFLCRDLRLKQAAHHEGFTAVDM